MVTEELALARPLGERLKVGMARRGRKNPGGASGQRTSLRAAGAIADLVVERKIRQRVQRCQPPGLLMRRGDERQRASRGLANDLYCGSADVGRRAHMTVAHGRFEATRVREAGRRKPGIGQLPDQEIDRSINRSIDQIVVRSIDRFVFRSIDRFVLRSIHRRIHGSRF
jgi:hypothetical protein